MKSRLEWTRTTVHPLEYRATVGSTVLILRALKDDPIWEAAVHFEDRPVRIARHDSYFAARAWAEGAA